MPEPGSTGDVWEALQHRRQVGGSSRMHRRLNSLVPHTEHRGKKMPYFFSREVVSPLRAPMCQESMSWPQFGLRCVSFHRMRELSSMPHESRSGLSHCGSTS